MNESDGPPGGVDTFLMRNGGGGATGVRMDEEHYRDIVESQADMICRFRPDGTVLFVNGAYARACGTTPQELMGRRFWDFIPEADRPGVRAMLDRLTPELPEVWIENRFEAADGERWTLWTNRALKFDRDGRLLEAQSTGINITERKRAEERLKRSEQELNDFFESASIGLHWVGPDGLILRANQAELDMLGYAREEYVGRHIAEFHVEKKVIDDILARLARGETLREYPAQMRRKDGTIRDVLINSSVLFEDGEFIHTRCFTTDVTERRRAEEALRKNEEWFRLATSAGHVGVWEWNVVENKVNWSDTIYDIHGLSREAFDGTVDGFVKFIHPDDRARVGEAIQRALSADSPYELEFRAVRPDGSVVWIYTHATVVRDADGAPIRMLGGTVDVTRRKEAELALREREERYALVVAGTEAAIWDWDVPAKRVVYSPRWKELRGLSDDEVSDSEEEWSKGIHPDDVARVMAAVQAHFEGRTPVFAEEYRIRHKDGHWVWILDRGIARRDDSGRIVRMAGSETDVTERKRFEQHLMLLVDELNHRVKNTLATVQSIAAQSLRGVPLADEIRDLLESRLIALSRSHDLLTRENWDTARLYDVVVQALEPFGGADAEQVHRFAVSGDEIRLRPKTALALGMAFHELATNAAKYGALSNGSGRVSVAWSVADNRLKLTWRESGGPVVMPPKHRGFGSRLIERGLARELNGEVRIEFAPEGVVFGVEMPATGRDGA